MYCFFLGWKWLTSYATPIQFERVCIFLLRWRFFISGAWSRGIDWIVRMSFNIPIAHLTIELWQFPLLALHIMVHSLGAMDSSSVWTRKRGSLWQSSTVWSRRCTFKLHWSVNFLSHWWHANGFSPVWIRKCDWQPRTCFSGQGIHFWQSYHVRVISKIQANFRFYSCSRVLMIGSYGFSYFFIFYVFDVKESIFDNFTKLSCSDDLEKPSQFPVLQVLEAIDDWVSWIFVISFFSTFQKSRNPFFTVSRSYRVLMTSKIQVDFQFHSCSRYWWLGLSSITL